nr:TOBE domain-containing protein [Sneathiella glossodoripedis]
MVGEDAGQLKGKVTFIRDLGSSVETFIDVEGTMIVAVTSPRERQDLSVGQNIGLQLPAEQCVVLTK